MTPPVFSRRAIAALFITRQHLDRPLGRRLTAASLSRFAEDAGGIQLDSINVIARAHHLTLWSRARRGLGARGEGLTSDVRSTVPGCGSYRH